MAQETFNRKEVRALLKQQIKASAASYGRMEANPALFRLPAYREDNIKICKRLNSVKPIKF